MDSDEHDFVLGVTRNLNSSLVRRPHSLQEHIGSVLGVTAQAELLEDVTVELVDALEVADEVLEEHASAVADVQIGSTFSLGSE